MRRLEGKVVLITGAGSGLGAQIARRFAEAGASLIINDLHIEAAQAVAEEVSGLAIAADVADSKAVQKMFLQVASNYNQLDVLVNNAGFGFDGNQAMATRVNEVPFKQMAEMETSGKVETHLDITVEMTDDEWHRMIGVHLNGTFFCSREALRIMNPQMSGCIINMGSIMGTSGGIGSNYCAAKGGILGFTRSLAREVVTRNIRVNALAPGFIDTALTEPFKAARTLLEAQTPMGRFGDTDDIAWAALYLASEEAKFVTGQTLSPNGGFVMSQ